MWGQTQIAERSDFQPLLPVWEHAIFTTVRVIARGTLNDFVQNRVERKLQRAVKDQLDCWYAEMVKATWRSSAELKAQYRSASIVSSERVVFNIKVNDYRLIVAINYRYQVLLIKWLGTHTEYDQIDAKQVEYEKARYANPSN
jgi:mRNA interferase HigB